MFLQNLGNGKQRLSNPDGWWEFIAPAGFFTKLVKKGQYRNRFEISSQTNTVKTHEIIFAADVNVNTPVIANNSTVTQTAALIAGATAKNFFSALTGDNAVTILNPTTLRIEEDGVYSLDVNHYLGSGNTTARKTPAYLLFVNNVFDRVVGNHSYIRRASGHMESSINFTKSRRFSVGDTIQIRTAGNSITGTVNAIAIMSSMNITKLGI